MDAMQQQEEAPIMILGRRLISDRLVTGYSILP